ncbi:hypothetical protein DFH07DRAFT_795903 [Mycena maculata]|uniref:Uncharacterized protein n=1 Tax=Mycena maculata TaxID=230809 RepID=A0AAD7K5T1_9AGAR|nr:hypothetical protein DFH07DRAFT_795903 [Mycena maculata]
MSVTSSNTLPTEVSTPEWDPNTVSYDVVDLILSHAVGQVIHDAVESVLHGQPITLSSLPGWSFLGDLAGVSRTFRAIMLKLVALAFRIPLPSERIFLEAYKKLRSLLLFAAATSAGAVMDPPEGWQSPLMRAYGHYAKARFLARGRLIHRSVVSLRSHRAEIYLALRFCNGTGAELAYPLLDASHSQLGSIETDRGSRWYVIRGSGNVCIA